MHSSVCGGFIIISCLWVAEERGTVYGFFVVYFYLFDQHLQEFLPKYVLVLTETAEGFYLILEHDLLGERELALDNNFCH